MRAGWIRPKGTRIDPGNGATMIEFKAPCGHTIRAKDEDAGRAMRCSYCGRTANVPESRDDRLDFLLEDTEELAGGDAGVQPRSRRRRLLAKRPRRRKPLDPVRTIKRMCIAAALVIAVIVVADQAGPPAVEGVKTICAWFQEVLGEWFPDDEQDDKGKEERVTEEQFKPDCGLVGRLSTGIYVTSVPPGATIYWAKQEDAGVTGRLCDQKGENVQSYSLPDTAAGKWLPVLGGTWVIEAEFSLRDRKLMDEHFPYHDRYLDFRREVRKDPSPQRRSELADDYFVPDGAEATFINETSRGLFIVRQYRDVTVQKGKPKGVCALFLPRTTLPGREGFSIGRLVTDCVLHYVPRRMAYVFDEAYVRDELLIEYESMPSGDQDYVIEALSLIGMTPYTIPHEGTVLFGIDLDTCELTVKGIDRP